MFIDTHTHLYSEQFDDDRNAVVKRAIAGGVTSFFLPNIDLDSVEPLLKLEQTFPENCHAMMGLHPCSVQANYMNQLEQLYAWFKKRSFCAVGEIGIDLYWDKTYVEEQKNAFRIQINWAKEFKIPIVIHARDSFKEIFEILDEENSPDLTGIFHCFTGDLNDVRKIQQYGGFVFGIGGVVTYKKST
ncbi:MAG TPA: TatD family hydrolase, partial [Fluviicola sp.]|nr:TatD family hydrolase [Fluviicola sp.]